LVHIYLDSEVMEHNEKYLARGNDVGQIKYVLLITSTVNTQLAAAISFFVVYLATKLSFTYQA